MVLSIIVLYQHTYVCYFSSKIRTNLQKMLQICVTIYFYCNCCPLLFSMSLSHNLQPSPFLKLLQTCKNNPFSKIFFALYEKRGFLSKFFCKAYGQRLEFKFDERSQRELPKKGSVFQNTRSLK